MADLDLSAFLGRFREEAKDLLQKLSDGLLALEKNPHDKETLAEITRAAHTLKGNAGFLELTDINKVAHAMEDLLATIRDGEIPVTSSVFDILLSSTDILDALVQVTASGEPVSDDVDAAVQALRSAASQELPPEKPQPKGPEPEQKKKLESASRPSQEPPAPPEERHLKHFRSLSGRLLDELRSSLATLKVPSDLQEMAQTAQRLRDAAELLEVGRAAQLTQHLIQALEAAARAPELPPDEGIKLISSALDVLDQIASSQEAPDADQLMSRLARLSSMKARARVERAKTPPPASQKGLPARSEKQKVIFGERGPDTIRVSTARVDTLVNLTGEIVINQRKAEGQQMAFKEITALEHESGHAWNALRTKIAELSRLQPAPPRTGSRPSLPHEESIDALVATYETLKQEIDERIGKFSSRLDDVVGTLKVASTRLQEHATDMRMLPLSILFDDIPRAVRDMARQFDKKIECRIIGRETLLDKKMLEGLRGPLIHIIRNSVDHGIESPEERSQAGKPELGVIEVSAQQEGDRVMIQIRDDGRGIDPDKVIQKALESGIIDSAEAQTMSRESAIYLVFQPGLSTRSVVSEISGRGVGMDVVKKDIEDLKGEVTLASELGRGTVVTMRLPLTLAVIPTLLVECQRQKYAVPSSAVKRIIEVEPAEIHSVEGREAVVCDGKTVPLVSMKDVLRLEGASHESDRARLPVVVISHAQDEIAFLVDAILEEQQLVVKNLSGNLQDLINVAGGAILGTGEVVIILHVPQLISSAKGAPRRALTEELAHKLKAKERGGKVLVVEDSLTTRELMRSVLEASGYQVDVAVDGVDGLRKVSDNEYDVVVTDILMPRMDGFEMVQRIKRDPRRRSVPVIIITSRASDADKKRGMEVGADMFIVKTEFDQSSFLDAVSKFVG